MFIPKTAEYGIRCMAQIALLPWESSISAEELHKLVGGPRDYLSKILRKLTSCGLLQAEKGHGGGFKLTSPPSSISFLKVFNALGLSFDPDHCAFGWGRCNPGNPCPLHKAFSALNGQVIQWASSTTLADVNHTAEMITRLRTSALSQARRERAQKKRSSPRK